MLETEISKTKVLLAGQSRLQPQDRRCVRFKCIFCACRPYRGAHVLKAFPFLSIVRALPLFLCAVLLSLRPNQISNCWNTLLAACPLFCTRQDDGGVRNRKSRESYVPNLRMQRVVSRTMVCYGVVLVIKNSLTLLFSSIDLSTECVRNVYARARSHNEPTNCQMSDIQNYEHQTLRSGLLQNQSFTFRQEEDRATPTSSARLRSP